MLVFSSVRMGVNPEINALATLILGVVGIVGFIAWYLMARAKSSGCAISSVQEAAEPPKICNRVNIGAALWRRFHGRLYVGIVY
jgi:hypothetical protein